MDERSYADLVALCQFLPGPASSQVGIGIGIVRAGITGGIISWIGFTLPSVLALVLFAYLLQGMNVAEAGWIRGLHLVAVAIVAQAVLGMSQKLTPDRNRITIAIATASITLLWQSALIQIILLAAAGLLGLWMYRRIELPATANLHIPISRTMGFLCLTMFFGLLFLLPLIRELSGSGLGFISLFDSFYRSGSLVFGGGHVVLPLLEKELVPTGWISQDSFMAGYGAAQAIPGPLFTFAAYLGAIIGGITGALVATAAIFLPAFLLVVGVLPFWNSMRGSHRIQGAFMGINAAVVGILLAALYNPLWTTAVVKSEDFVLVSILFVMLMFWKLPPWVVVLAGVLGGIIIG
jgi:chromate transporter